MNDEMEEHVQRVHSKDDEVRKRPAPSYNCDVPDCGSTFDSNEKLLEHEQNQHVKSDQTFSINEKSPTASPSRKKTVMSTDASKDDTNVVEDVVMTEVEENIKDQLELRIRQLENKIPQEREEKNQICAQRKHPRPIWPYEKLGKYPKQYGTIC